MSKKPTTKRTRDPDMPYDQKNAAETADFWDGATQHTGVAELRAKRGRPKLREADKKQQISLRVDADVLDWYRDLGTGWQTRMNAVLRAYRDASQ